MGVSKLSAKVFLKKSELFLYNCSCSWCLEKFGLCCRHVETAKANPLCMYFQRM